MEFSLLFLMVAGLSFGIIRQVSGEAIKCYVCNGREEPKCGKTWEFSDEEAAKYIEECQGNVTACQKIDSKDTIHGIMTVTRSCFNESVVVDNMDFLKSCTEFSLGHACYCVGDGDKPCNAGRQITGFTAALASVVMATLSAVLYSFYC